MTTKPASRGATLSLVDTNEGSPGKNDPPGCDGRGVSSDLGITVESTTGVPRGSFRRRFCRSELFRKQYAIWPAYRLPHRREIRRADVLRRYHRARRRFSSQCGNFPVFSTSADLMAEICPDAWLINYVNPSAVMGIGLMRHSRVIEELSHLCTRTTCRQIRELRRPAHADRRGSDQLHGTDRRV